VLEAVDGLAERGIGAAVEIPELPHHRRSRGAGTCPERFGREHHITLANAVEEEGIAESALHSGEHHELSMRCDRRGRSHIECDARSHTREGTSRPRIKRDPLDDAPHETEDLR
jgi:hypothetical protein